jgi:hypothetical protein
MNSLAAGAALTEAEKLFNIAINSFEIRNYGLFGSEDDGEGGEES